MVVDSFAPKISVVTVVLNNVQEIENTVLSVVNQTYPNLEYIVIDGGSSDGTLEIIERYRDRISIILSEKDKGLYDAMNKGTNRANGDWIIYMNSGDQFYSDNVLAQIFHDCRDKIENMAVIYSDTLSIVAGKESIVKARSLKYIWCGAPSVHQSQFVKANIAKKFPFDLTFKINADYDFIYNVYKKENAFLYLDNTIISKCNAERGLSKTISPKFTLRENFNVSRKYSSRIQIVSLFLLNVSKYIYAMLKNQAK